MGPTLKFVFELIGNDVPIPAFNPKLKSFQDSFTYFSFILNKFSRLLPKTPKFIKNLFFDSKKIMAETRIVIYSNVDFNAINLGFAIRSGEQKSYTSLTKLFLS